MHNYLLEIGLEDMPAHVVTPSLKQLEQKTAAFLKEERLTFERIETFATPRRLALLVHGLADKQTDIEEDAKGPAKKIALDADGNWSKAAMGFARGQEATTDDIIFRELKGVEYAYIHKAVAGLPAADVLSKLIDVIKSLTFPTRMHWGDYQFEYIRPVHWIVSLLDDAIVPMELLDVRAGRTTQGHRFLGHEVSLADALDYVEALRAQFVLVQPEERKQLIVDQIQALADANDWQVDLDPELLEEVNNLVEWPTAFAGNFDAKYLAIPEAVLITSMKDNQRYFYARDKSGQMINVFIGVRNGNDDYMENVRAGNVKVLTARLEDAAFFYEEDQKRSLDSYLKRLDTVSFHDKIGSMGDKAKRMAVIAEVLAGQLGLSTADQAAAVRAAAIAKFDLVTAMVGEFAELQGTMGGVYAQIFGEAPAVAQAISEHYRPISADGELPTTVVASVVSLADKLDSLMNFFAIDLIPTGSNDPYALRRQAYGVVRILAANDWSFNVANLQADIASALDAAHLNPGMNYVAHAVELVNFMRDRVSQILSQEKVRHDIIDAIVASPSVNPTSMIDAAHILSAHADDEDFKLTMEALGRVLRITAKSRGTGQVSPDLFENDSEVALHEAIEQLVVEYNRQASDANYQALRGLTGVINDYFDATMIMADDEAVKNNRLSELRRLASLIEQFGDVSAIIVK